MSAHRHSAPSDLSGVRAALVAEADRLAAAIELARTDEDDVRHDVAGHDQMDDAVTRMGTDQSSYQARGATQRQEQVRAATQRIDEGVYGVCIDCGGAIGQERLIALPTALRCIGCQQAQRRH